MLFHSVTCFDTFTPKGVQMISLTLALSSASETHALFTLDLVTDLKKKKRTSQYFFELRNTWAAFAV